MKRWTLFLTLFILPLAGLSLFACASRFLSPEEVASVRLVWRPSRALRTAPLEMNLDAATRNLFVDKLSASAEIDPVWVTDLVLFEGSYEITVTGKDGASRFYQFGGDSILYSPSVKKYHQNKDLHLFISQILFRELARRNIRLDDSRRTGG